MDRMVSDSTAGAQVQKLFRRSHIVTTPSGACWDCGIDYSIRIALRLKCLDFQCTQWRHFDCGLTEFCNTCASANRQLAARNADGYNAIRKDFHQWTNEQIIQSLFAQQRKLPPTAGRSTDSLLQENALLKKELKQASAQLKLSRIADLAREQEKQKQQKQQKQQRSETEPTVNSVSETPSHPSVPHSSKQSVGAFRDSHWGSGSASTSASVSDSASVSAAARSLEFKNRSFIEIDDDDSNSDGDSDFDRTSSFSPLPAPLFQCARCRMDCGSQLELEIHSRVDKPCASDTDTTAVMLVLSGPLSQASSQASSDIASEAFSNTSKREI